MACVPAPSVQCLACVEDSDCIFSAHRCRQLPEDQSAACLVGCGSDAPTPGCTGEVGVRGCCPEGNLCQSLDGVLLCVPDGPGCDCTAATIGRTRPCRRPGQGGATCAGEQTCAPGPNGPAWTICDAAEVTREVCNGLDDNCDGLTDDPFIDTQGTGTYDTDEHCGQCFSSCLTLPNAIGACAARGGNPGCEIDQCLPGRVAGGGFCRLDEDCSPGFGCDPSFFQCVRRCGAGCGAGQTCVDGFCAPACASDQDCAAFGDEATCQAGRCGVDYRYVDKDEAVSNGCECPVLASGLDDLPDLYPGYPEAGVPFVDRDCDGVDGVAARALFVRAGAGPGRGTREAPFATINAALANFDPRRHDVILVAGGLYVEAVFVPDNVELYGGYSPDFLDRDVAGRPSILAPNRPATDAGPAAALVIEAAATTVAGFVIQAWDGPGGAGPGDDGGNSVAVLINRATPQVVFQNNEVIAGRGGNGAPGPAGLVGGSGSDGGDGLPARECMSTTCSGESMQGGAAGRNASCPSAVGVAGARSAGNADPQLYQPPLGLNGRGGDTARYSSANNPQFSDLCKYDCSVAGDQVGQPAQSGQNGGGGQGGRGCASATGRIDGVIWRPAPAADGASGRDGEGGGGGGAGGNVINLNSATCRIGNLVGDLGSTGGGGGAGGCGGTRGLHGGGGGASIAILVVNPRGGGPSILGNRIVRGLGGDGGGGGAGGSGGSGGQGGDGGLASAPAWCAGDAGKGGRGGDGGAGGGGGGGCGGVSYGVAGRGVATSALLNNNDFNTILGGRGGRGGAGGRSPGSGTGTDGREGDADAVHVFP